MQHTRSRLTALRGGLAATSLNLDPMDEQIAEEPASRLYGIIEDRRSLETRVIESL